MELIDEWPLSFPLSTLGKGKREMCVLGLLIQGEHLRYPAFRVVSVEQRGKWTRGTEWNMRVKQSNSQIPSSSPIPLWGYFCATRGSEGFLPKLVLGFTFPHDAVRLWIFKGLLEGGRKALDTKNIKQPFLQEVELLQFGGLMGWISSKWRQMFCRHG